MIAHLSTLGDNQTYIIDELYMIISSPLPNAVQQLTMSRRLHPTRDERYITGLPPVGPIEE